MNAKERRTARHQPPSAEDARPRRRKDPITVDQVVETSLGIIATEGYDALTMRRLSSALDTGPASLYAHVVNKADLDELLIGRLCARLTLPAPNPTTWRDQLRAVCEALRDQYLQYPGISRAALAMAPTDLETLRVSEGMLAILLTAGIAPQRAAWTIDALLLYVAAHCLELAVAHRKAENGDEIWPADKTDLLHRLTTLPAAAFPHTTRHAAELTAGTTRDRFDFTVGLMIDGLA